MCKRNYGKQLLKGCPPLLYSTPKKDRKTMSSSLSTILLQSKGSLLFYLFVDCHGCQWQVTFALLRLFGWSAPALERQPQLRWPQRCRELGQAARLQQAPWRFRVIPPDFEHFEGGCRLYMFIHMEVSTNGGTPKWMVCIMENPMKMDDLEVPLF